MEFTSKSEQDLGNIAQEIIKNYPGKRILYLIGELGSGKTTFTSQFIKFLGSIENAQSPTFILHREYKLEDGLKVHHIDLYRIKDSNELAELRIEKLRYTKDFVLIEWADKYEYVLDEIFAEEQILVLNFSYSSTPDERIIDVTEKDSK